MNIAHFGTYDIDNYGDLLFPYIVEWRLSKHNLVHVSPVGGSTAFSDSIKSIAYADAVHQDFDVVIVGGGNIVKIEKTPLNKYSAVSNTAYPWLWLGANDIAKKLGVPLIFNAPSISTLKKGYLEKRLFKTVLMNSLYVAFRESQSAGLCNAITERNTAVIVPDTAFDISRMWPCTNQINQREMSSYFIVHVNSRYSLNNNETINAIDEISNKLNASPIFLPIGICHGDFEFAKNLASLSKCSAKVEDDISIRNFANLISGAKAYIGSSMHGFITALSYGTPALMVLNNKPMHKFTGLLEVIGITNNLSIQTSWDNVSNHLTELIVLTPEQRNNSFTLLDEHWSNVEIAINSTIKIAKTATQVNSWKATLNLAVFESKCKRALIGLVHK